MKKFTKLFAALGAVAMLGLGVFTSCGSDDDDDPVLESIAVTTPPTKTQYTVGDEESAFDPAGLVITEKWTEGKKDVDVAYGDDNKDAFTFSGFNASEATESQAITVTYEKKTATFSVTVKSASENPDGDGTTGDGTQKTLSSIAVKTEPTKKDYALNTGFSADGLVITLTYSDGDTEDVTYSAENAADFSFDFDSSTEGTKEVTVTYKNRSAAEKITVTVTDKKVTKLEKSEGATAVEVKYGTEASAITGLSLVVTYDQGDPETITSGYTVTDYDKNTVGDQTVTVTYGTKAASEGASNSTTYTVKVVDYATGIVATLAEGKTYTAGDATAKTDVVVTYKMASGAAGETVAAEKYTVTPETVKLSDTALTVTSTEDFATKTETVDITGKVARAVFTKFDAADLRALNGDADNVKKDIEAEDGSWKLTGATDREYPQAKADAHETYDYAAGEDGTVTAGKKWTHRLSYHTKGFKSGLSLYVGANAEVTLRVDGGSVKAVKDNAGVAGKTNLTFTGAGDAVTWEPYIGGVTTYVTVKGNSDGYVVISTTDSSVGANIYGITKVTSKPTENLPEDTVFKKDDGTDATIGTAAVYNNPIIAGAAASYTQGETITASISNAAELVTPSKTQKVYADGHLGEAEAGSETVDAASIKWTATGTAEGNTEANEIGTGASLSLETSATESDEKYIPADTYSVVASYTVGTGEAAVVHKSEAVSVLIKEAGDYHSVKFFDGESELTAFATEVKAGNTITKPADPTKSGYTFAGWYKEAVLTNEFDFTTPTGSGTDEIDIYAKWNQLQTATVTYFLEKYVPTGADDAAKKLTATNSVDAVISGAAAKITVPEDENYTLQANTKIEEGFEVKVGSTSVTPGINTIYVDLPITVVKACRLTSVSIHTGASSTGNAKAAVSYYTTDADKQTTIKDEIAIKNEATTECVLETPLELSGGTVTIRVNLYGTGSFRSKTLSLGKTIVTFQY